MLPGVMKTPLSSSVDMDRSISYFFMRSKRSRRIASVRPRRARTSSAPTISVISESTTVPPASTIISAASPTAGLADSPEKASEEPHSSATMSSDRSPGSLGFVASFACMPRTISMPSALVVREPPCFCTTSVSTGVPALRMPSETRAKEAVSHPSPTTSTAATLGCRPRPMNVSSVVLFSSASKVQP